MTSITNTPKEFQRMKYWKGKDCPICLQPMKYIEIEGFGPEASCGCSNPPDAGEIHDKQQEIDMSILTAGRTARSITWIAFAFEKVLGGLTILGKRGYEIISSKQRFKVTVMVEGAELSVKASVTAREIQTMLAAMKHFESIQLIITK
jgi:hypothetical protein|tara:strand:- start:5791 stop:6234 length:444 start_codon:yes stop_codon:yes gene_type:complete